MSYKFTTICLTVLAVLVGCAGFNQRERSPDVERGRYVVEIMGCGDCHTPSYMGNESTLPEDDWLVGGDLGFHGSWGTAYPANLRLLLNDMSEEDWLVQARQMRQNSPMSWSRLPKATDQDLRAVYRFVKYLGPKGTQAPDRLPAGVVPTTDFIYFPEPH